MCPACIATAAWIATGTSSAGVFFGLLIKKLPHRRPSKPGRSWVKVDKRYLFDGPHGRQTLAELFAGRSQLIGAHFMSIGLSGQQAIHRPRRQHVSVPAARSMRSGSAPLRCTTQRRPSPRVPRDLAAK